MNNNITKLREKKGITQAELARRLEVSTPFINRVENGKKKCSVKMALRISEILDCTLNDIFLP